MADNRIVTATIGVEQYETSLNNGVHVVYSDEPTEIGGKDKGPSPGDFLRMSLASCTAITLRMYANRKGFEIEKIIVEVRSEQLEGKTLFHRNVFVKGTITNEQREKLMKIANACPVHKVLENPIEISTTISS
jgi:putative redox protein